MTFGWACRRSTALLSRGITSCVLIWRTGRRRSTGLNISSHWRDLPKNTSFTSPTSLVICLMPWPTAPAWGSLQRTGILMTTKTPTATAVTQVGAPRTPKCPTITLFPMGYAVYLIHWQVVGGSMAVGKLIWMEGISGWEQKEGDRGGGASTGGLLQALPFTWRRPRWHYCQPNRLTNTESPNLHLKVVAGNPPFTK